MDLSFAVGQMLTGLASASSLFIIASGLTLVFGVTRIVNFAHGSLYMLGAYFAVTLVPRLLEGGCETRERRHAGDDRRLPRCRELLMSHVGALRGQVWLPQRAATWFTSP